MQKVIVFFYLIFAVVTMGVLGGCSSAGYSGSASYYRGNAWEYDRYYRSGVNRHYNRPAARSEVRSKAANQAGRAARSGGAARPGGGGRGGRR